MSKAVRIDRSGGPEELKIVEVVVGDPGPGEIRIRHKASAAGSVRYPCRCSLAWRPPASSRRWAMASRT